MDSLVYFGIKITEFFSNYECSICHTRIYSDHFEQFKQTTSNRELCYVKGISRLYQLNLSIVILNRYTIRYDKSVSFNELVYSSDRNLIVNKF